MVAGMSFTLAYIIYFQFMGGSADNYLWGISPEGIGCIGMLLNFAVAFGLSLFTPATPEKVQQMVKAIHVPSDSGPAQTH
jgi:cation/acetate symporter